LRAVVGKCRHATVGEHGARGKGPCVKSA
jgi:hypothetical protein